MAVAGSLTYDTKLDTSGFNKGLNQINKDVSTSGTKMKNIIGALGITKIISAGVSMITSSIGDAVARIDTLNNYPKVMSNLGISNAEATKSINKLSKSLTGLPTTLDSAALSVQRLTSKNGDVNKSTDIFLALNNAILAGGASTDIQATAMEQLSQAYAKGKPDMMEWRAVQTAMPAQLKQVAQAMLGNKDTLDRYLESAREYADNNPLSSTAQELVQQLEEVKNGTGDMTTAMGTALRTGIISMDDFTDTIVKMNKKGTNGFQSFEKQARNATGGIKTSITNMKTAVARGVANVIQSFDKALKKNGLGGVADVISNIGKKFESVLKSLSKQIEKINLKSLINILKSLIPIVGSVVAGFTAYDLVLKGIKITDFVKNTMSMITQLLATQGAFTSATASVTAFNTTLTLSPIGLIVGAVAGLTAGLVVLGETFGFQKDEITKSREKLEEYKNTMDELDKASDKQIQNGFSEIQRYQDLYLELGKITDANGKVKDGYEDRANFIINELNNALGTEITMTNGIIQKYDEVKESISGVIEQKRAKIVLDAEEGKYNEAIKKQAELYEELRKATSNQKEAQSNLNSWLETTAEKLNLSESELKKLLETNELFNQSLPISGNELVQIQTQYQGLQEEVNKTTALVKEEGKTYSENQVVISDYERALQEMESGNYETVLKIFNDTKEYSAMTKDERKKAYDEDIEAQSQYLISLTAHSENYNKESFDQLYIAGKNKLDELKRQREAEFGDYVESNQKKKDETIKNQNEIASEVSKGQKKSKDEIAKGQSEQINEIKKSKLKFQESSKENLNAYTGEIKNGKGKAKKELVAFGNEANGEFKKINKKGGKESATYLGDGFIGGLNSKKGSMFNSVSSLGISILKQFKTSLKEHSPSKATEEMGVHLVEGAEIGVDKRKKSLLNKINTLGQDVLSKMENEVNIETGKMSVSGLNGTVSEILNANSIIKVENYNTLELDGEKVYENQQNIQKNKNLQYGFNGGNAK